MTTVSKISLSAAGPLVSRLALGFARLAQWELNSYQLLDLLHASIDLGITTMDHADIYGNQSSQRLFGDALAKRPALRQQMQIISKCGIQPYPAYDVKHYDTSKDHIINSVENSLMLLGTDYLDLLLIHRPDPLMDADEVAEAFAALQQAGKVRHFGVSNHTPSQFELLSSRVDVPLVTNQVQFSLLANKALEDGTFDQAQRLRFSPMAWSPLAGGEVFTGDEVSAKRTRLALREVGIELGTASYDQVALAWILTHPANIVPVLGTSRLDRLQSAAQAAPMRLSRPQWFRLLQAARGKYVP
ncbi:MAG: aldo/keto reductase [Chloroflexota bacterium]